ncbi:unnamed protein product [Closterium sp. NIES-54]
MAQLAPEAQWEQELRPKREAGALSGQEKYGDNTQQGSDDTKPGDDDTQQQKSVQLAREAQWVQEQELWHGKEMQALRKQEQRAQQQEQGAQQQEQRTQHQAQRAQQKEQDAQRKEQRAQQQEQLTQQKEQRVQQKKQGTQQQRTQQTEQQTQQQEQQGPQKQEQQGQTKQDSTKRIKTNRKHRKNVAAAGGDKRKRAARGRDAGGEGGGRAGRGEKPTAATGESASNTTATATPPASLDITATAAARASRAANSSGETGASASVTVGAACKGRAIYVYPLSARFNQWMVDDCVESRIKGFCLTSRHGGLGTRLAPWDDAVEGSGGGSGSSYGNSTSGSGSVGSSSSSSGGSGSGDGSSGESSGTSGASEGWRNQWFLTESVNNEEIFHSRLLQHPCRTSDPDSADFLFIPAYLGWSVWSLVEHGLFVDRDQPGIELERYLLEENPDFKRLVDQGNHVLVLGRPIWDFRRVEEWGSDLWWRPTFNNVTLLTVEATREWYGREVFSIPYPTSFHPVGSAELQGWMNHARDHARPFLYAFVGGRRAKETIEGALRGALLKECEIEPEKCLLLECYSADAEAVTEAAAEIGREAASRKAAAAGKGEGIAEGNEDEEPRVDLPGCTDPRRVAGAMLRAEFCLQPVGDSQTRRSFFDSIIAGCIPVVFSTDTFDSQYPWFFDPKPEARRKIAVMVDPEDMISGRVKIVELLGKISVERKEEMRQEIRLHVPRLLLRDHTKEGEVGEEGLFEDMVDITINGLVERKKMREAGTAGDYFPWFNT